jgi:hypothetical protein
MATKIILNYWRYMKIPEVDYYLNKIDCDKLTFNYLEYPTPYHILDDFKKNMDEYDYIVLVTNDVIVKQSHIDTLIQDIENYGSMGRPPVMSGVFNVDIEDNFDKLNICWKWPDKVYDWINRDSVSGYQKVEFMGLPLTAIRTDIFKRYEWTGSFNAGDRRFCKWCIDNDIPLICNTDNKMQHLRYYGEKPIGETQSYEWKKRV